MLYKVLQIYTYTQACIYTYILIKRRTKHSTDQRVLEFCSSAVYLLPEYTRGYETFYGRPEKISSWLADQLDGDRLCSESGLITRSEFASGKRPSINGSLAAIV